MQLEIYRDVATSALVEHVCKTGHTINWTNTDIRDQPKHIWTMPIRVLDDPHRDTHTEQRTWNLTLHIQTTALALPMFVLCTF